MVESGRLSARIYWRLALRSLGRNRKRTGITLASLAGGLAALTFLGALNVGWLGQMKDNFILNFTGHLQVVPAEQSADAAVADITRLGTKLDQDPAIRAWTPRYYTTGLASVATSNAGIALLAVDPGRERRVTRLADCLESGSWLTEDDDHGLILGHTLAENLGAKVGDKVILTADSSARQLNADAFHLRGILCGGAPQVDRSLALIPLRTAQEWLQLGHAVSSLVVRAREHDLSDELAERLRREFAGDGVRIRTWAQLDPLVNQWVGFSYAYSAVVLFIVMALVITQILNTMLMALHERRREIGMMEALGTSKRQIFLLMLLEGMILVIVGGVGGYLLGVAAVLAFEQTGLDLSAFSDALRFFYMSPVIQPRLSMASGMLLLSATFAAALLAGLYPAWKATRIQPARAIAERD
ncbi:MAG: ABC transporter permease [Chromatiales bacterium]|nr:ABC transporter permease [Chromatiales bacterium]